MFQFTDENVQHLIIFLRLIRTFPSALKLFRKHIRINLEKNICTINFKA